PTVIGDNVFGARLPAPSSSNPLAIRANRIFVRVYNVNDQHCSFLYEASLVGVDLEANVAVLKVDDRLIFNKSNPALKMAPFLKWGKSKKYPTGSNVHTVANSNLSVRQYNRGVIVNNYDQDVLLKFYSSIDTNMPFTEGMIGAPLVDDNGNAVGIITG